MEASCGEYSQLPELQSEICDQLAKALIKSKKFRKAETIALDGIARMNMINYHHANLIIAYIFQNKKEQAMTYLKARSDASFDEYQQLTRVILSDINALRTQQMDHEDFAYFERYLSKAWTANVEICPQLTLRSSLYYLHGLVWRTTVRWGIPGRRWRSFY